MFGVSGSQSQEIITANYNLSMGLDWQGDTGEAP